MSDRPPVSSRLSGAARIGLDDRYRLVDITTKLLGLALLSLALEIGIASAPGLLLALAGVAAGVCTVFITEDTL